MKNDKLLQKAAASGILLPSTASAPSLRNASKWNLSAAALNVDGRRPLLPEEHTRSTYESTFKTIHRSMYPSPTFRQIEFVRWHLCEGTKDSARSPRRR